MITIDLKDLLRKDVKPLMKGILNFAKELKYLSFLRIIMKGGAKGYLDFWKKVIFMK